MPTRHLASVHVENRTAASGCLFVVSVILVPPRVRTENQGRPCNLARRLQQRLLTDHGAALGVMLVSRSDSRTTEALRCWRWRCLEGDTPRPSAAPRSGPLGVPLPGA